MAVKFLQTASSIVNGVRRRLQDDPEGDFHGEWNQINTLSTHLSQLSNTVGEADREAFNITNNRVQVSVTVVIQ